MTQITPQQWEEMQRRQAAQVQQGYERVAQQRAKDQASWQAAVDAQHAGNVWHRPWECVTFGQPGDAGAGMTAAQQPQPFSVGDFQGAYYKRFGRWPTVPEQQAARDAWERSQAEGQ